jgi:ribokinase
VTVGGRIVVVGAANVDLISYVPRLPSAGETLHGTSFQMGHGGKGANQAVMAARLGAEVSLVAKLGTDVFGDRTLDDLRERGVDTSHVHRTDRASSGVAPILVDDTGANTIVIVGGANDLLDVDEIERARPTIAAADVVVCQLEVPVEVSLAALRIARAEGVRTILNPAPARETLPDEAFELSDVLCPNEPETQLLTGGSVDSIDEAVVQAQRLRERGAGAVVLTLGERGCLVVDGDAGAVHLPSRDVEVVDTTGAGDAFVGSLATFLADGADLRDAAGRAAQVAAVSVTRRGTQTSFPAASELPPDVLASG